MATTRQSPVTRLNVKQHAVLDHLAANHEECKVVSWEINKRGDFCPVIRYKGGHRLLDSDGTLVGVLMETSA